MKTPRLFRLTLLALTALAPLVACGPQSPPPAASTPMERMTTVSGGSFDQEVRRHAGPVVVLFKGADASSLEMERRFKALAARYGDRVKFCVFPWATGGDTAPYRLELIPTTVLFVNGSEIDRVRGIPAESRLAAFDSDLDLWLRKQALQEKGDAFSADFSYRFDNTSRLKAGNY